MSSPTPANTINPQQAKQEPRVDNNPTPPPYPAPLIVEPASTHTQSWIILHGRGDTAFSFATSGPDSFLRLLQPHPHIRFVFPTAAPRYARVFDIADCTQWFDVYSWNSGENSGWQVQGLRETTVWIHELVRREAEVVGETRVVLGGLSMGCASVLVALLVWRGGPLGGVFGMSGWLPFAEVLEGEVAGGEAEGVRNAGVLGNKHGYGSACRRAVERLGWELGVPVGQGEAFLQTPILLMHGTDNDTVDIELGRRAADCLRKLGGDVVWKEYEGLGHWMSQDELDDVAKWAGSLVGQEAAGQH